MKAETDLTTPLTGALRTAPAHDASRKAALSDVRIHVKFRLSALWATVVLCYIYGDLFAFFRQSTLTNIVAGKAGFISTQSGLLGAAVSVAAPSLMVFLSLALAPQVGRPLNIILGVSYTLIIIATLPGAWMFYVFLGVVEATLTAAIVGYAWRWPREHGAADAGSATVFE